MASRAGRRGDDALDNRQPASKHWPPLQLDEAVRGGRCRACRALRPPEAEERRGACRIVSDVDGARGPINRKPSRVRARRDRARDPVTAEGEPAVAGGGWRRSRVFVKEQLDGLLCIEAGQRPAQAADGCALVIRHQQVVAARPGRRYVDGGEDPLLREITAQPQLHIACALELLEEHVVHPRVGFHLGPLTGSSGNRLPRCSAPRRGTGGAAAGRFLPLRRPECGCWLARRGCRRGRAA